MQTTSTAENAISVEDLLTFEAEKVIHGGGKPDFIVYKEIISKEISSNKATSNKVLRGTPKEATSKTDESFTFDEPILLTIVNVDKPTSAEGKISSMTARFGMFLCTRKDGCASDDYRIALLWRTQTTTCEDASTEFGKILYAAQMCAYLRKQEFEYEYLGPNCCRFKEFVSIFRFE